MTTPDTPLSATTPIDAQPKRSLRRYVPIFAGFLGAALFAGSLVLQFMKAHQVDTALDRAWEHAEAVMLEQAEQPALDYGVAASEYDKAASSYREQECGLCSGVWGVVIMAPRTETPARFRYDQGYYSAFRRAHTDLKNALVRAAGNGSEADVRNALTTLGAWEVRYLQLLTRTPGWVEQGSSRPIGLPELNREAIESVSGTAVLERVQSVLE